MRNLLNHVGVKKQGLSRSLWPLLGREICLILHILLISMNFKLLISFKEGSCPTQRSSSFKFRSKDAWVVGRGPKKKLISNELVDLASRSCCSCSVTRAAVEGGCCRKSSLHGPRRRRRLFVKASAEALSREVSSRRRRKSPRATAEVAETRGRRRCSRGSRIAACWVSDPNATARRRRL